MNDDERARLLVESWSVAEREAVCLLLSAQLADGWIPGVGDLEATVAVVREAHRAEASRTDAPPG